MKNKKVKQMICDVWEYSSESGVRGVYGYHFGRYWHGENYELITKYALCFDGYEMKCGVISLTADQLRGK